MISNECKEICRDFGMLVQNIICMADCYEEPINVFRKNQLYKKELEDKKNIILDMQETSDRISEEVKLIPIKDVEELQQRYGIVIMDYTDKLSAALRKEPYSNNDVKFKCDAIISIVLDMLYRQLRCNEAYQRLEKGDESENVQVQFLS